MYKKYAIKRILRGLLMYALLIFVFSFLFNQITERTQRALISEQIKMESQSLRNMTAEQMFHWRKLREKDLIQLYKLDKPLAERVVFNAINILTFRFGKSTIIRSAKGSQDVFTIVMEALPRTMLLFTTAIILQIFLGFWLGLKKAQKPGGKLDKTTSLMTMIIYGMPSWWFGMILILFFVYILRLFPSGGVNSVPTPTGIFFVLDRIWHMILPIMTLVLLGFWGTSFMIRNLVLGTLQEDFIMSARARGIPEKKVLYGHTLRSAAPPLVTMVLLSLLASISGAIIFEGIFSWPGLGNLYWIAVQQNDIPVLMGNLAITTGVYQAGLVILDLIYGFLDPRIKVGGKA
ncbi:ABC transporter permease [Treponema phagedenis]|uniref:ABC transporter permease n=1 Tax=Treponema phagedenis TaxID=162 RepID=A0A0B7H2G6_TREPH|nr:ABC transporter permease [Treponema phagedenis]NVP23717.1 ABC transporter permease [Treponema phagedenis]QEJ94458.1 ABC transporter permease [Treponema phagedenis]QEJ97525.1 ABC transporter permease [Treponema phagedenis]QEK01661.1 ABC transporter permease [Treponema phagedenis]QEK03092.1 ABC transporter permease [Treponema phagedenis]